MLERFEEKINELKQKVNPKFLGVVMFMVFGATILFGLEMANNFKRQKNQTQDDYNRSLYEVVGYIKNVEVELAKVQITTTPRLTVTTLADIWRQANLAKDNLSNLPVDQNSLSKASKYLSQLSDYSYSLMKQTMSNTKITKEQYDTVKGLYDESKELNTTLSDVFDDLNSGRIKWDELEKIGNEELPNAIDSSSLSNINKIGKTFQEYEGLIYDGAFSDHILTKEPQGISKDVVSSEDAKNKIKEIYGDEIEYINDNGEIEGRITLYRYQMKLKNKENIYTIDITKQGGKLYLMLSDRNVPSANISVEDANAKGLEFLKKLGIENVKETYYLMEENMITINYAAVQNDVTLYPDLIKVKIALDDGQICSAELQGYIFNHSTRENIKPKISMSTAKKVLNENIEIKSEGLAIIPTDSKEELLTYEFKGKIDDRDFIIYVNSNTGEEENVLLIINTPGGTLTF